MKHVHVFPLFPFVLKAQEEEEEEKEVLIIDTAVASIRLASATAVKEAPRSLLHPLVNFFSADLKHLGFVCFFYTYLLKQLLEC